MPLRIKIYCDLDGVLANFDKRYDELCPNGRPPDTNEDGGAAWWQPIVMTPHFWDSLELMPDAHQLWEAIKSFEHVTILSSPGQHDAERAKVEKLRWMRRHFPEANVMFKYSKEKHFYACPNSLLIDDRKSTIKRWKDAGGIAILHKSAAKTIADLEHLSSTRLTLPGVFK